MTLWTMEPLWPVVILWPLMIHGDLVTYGDLVTPQWIYDWQAWQEHLRRMETEVKASLQKSEQTAQEVDVEVKEASDRTNSLGKSRVGK